MGCRTTFEKIIGFIIAVLIGVGILTQPVQAPMLSTRATLTPTSTRMVTATPQDTPTSTVTPALPPVTHTFNAIRPEPGSVCAYNPAVEALLDGLDQSDWVNWIKLLSGEKSVTIPMMTWLRR